MKTEHTLALALAGLAALTVNANAAQKCTLAPISKAFHGTAIRCPLVQTARLIPPTYPGVDLSIGGIRIGMTVHQVEAIAQKHGFGKPNIVYQRVDGLTFLRGTVFDSNNYIALISYRISQNNGITRVLTVNFTSPATGNRSYNISEGNTFNSRDAKNKPWDSNAVTARLIHKYGQPSNEEVGRDTRYLCWNFREGSLIKTSPKHPDCWPGASRGGRGVAASDFPYDSPLLDVYISVSVDTMQGKILSLSRSFGDFQFAEIDQAEARKQFEHAAKGYDL